MPTDGGPSSWWSLSSSSSGVSSGRPSAAHVVREMTRTALRRDELGAERGVVARWGRSRAGLRDWGLGTRLAGRSVAAHGLAGPGTEQHRAAPVPAGRCGEVGRAGVPPGRGGARDTRSIAGGGRITISKQWQRVGINIFANKRQTARTGLLPADTHEGHTGAVLALRVALASAGAAFALLQLGLPALRVHDRAARCGRRRRPALQHLLQVNHHHLVVVEVVVQVVVIEVRGSQHVRRIARCKSKVGRCIVRDPFRRKARPYGWRTRLAPAAGEVRTSGEEAALWSCCFRRRQAGREQRREESQAGHVCDRLVTGAHCVECCDLALQGSAAGI